MTAAALRLYRERRIPLLVAVSVVYLAMLAWMCWHYVVEEHEWHHVEPVALASLVLAGFMALAALGRSMFLPALVFAAGGFIAEVIGVHTGLVFGSYHYNGFGMKWLGVPILIPLAWALLLVYISQIVGRLQLGRLAAALVGGLWMMAFDIVIDPIASGPPGCWQWHDGGAFYGVPLSNFVSWFAVSFVLMMIAPPLNRISRVIDCIGVTVALTAMLGAIKFGMWPVAAGAVMLMAAHFAVVNAAGMRERRQGITPRA